MDHMLRSLEAEVADKTAVDITALAVSRSMSWDIALRAGIHLGRIGEEDPRRRVQPALHYRLMNMPRRTVAAAAHKLYTSTLALPGIPGPMADHLTLGLLLSDSARKDKGEPIPGSESDSLLRDQLFSIAGNAEIVAIALARVPNIPHRTQAFATLTAALIERITFPRRHARFAGSKLVSEPAIDMGTPFLDMAKELGRAGRIAPSDPRLAVSDDCIRRLSADGPDSFRREALRFIGSEIESARLKATAGIPTIDKELHERLRVVHEDAGRWAGFEAAPKTSRRSLVHIARCAEHLGVLRCVQDFKLKGKASFQPGNPDGPGSDPACLRLFAVAATACQFSETARLLDEDRHRGEAPMSEPASPPAPDAEAARGREEGCAPPVR